MVSPQPHTERLEWLKRLHSEPRRTLGWENVLNQYVPCSRPLSSYSVQQEDGNEVWHKPLNHLSVQEPANSADEWGEINCPFHQHTLPMCQSLPPSSQNKQKWMLVILFLFVFHSRVKVMCRIWNMQTVPLHSIIQHIPVFIKPHHTLMIIKQIDSRFIRLNSDRRVERGASVMVSCC